MRCRDRTIRACRPQPVKSQKVERLGGNTKIREEVREEIGQEEKEEEEVARLRKEKGMLFCAY